MRKLGNHIPLQTEQLLIRWRRPWRISYCWWNVGGNESESKTKHILSIKQYSSDPTNWGWISLRKVSKRSVLFHAVSVQFLKGALCSDVGLVDVFKEDFTIITNNIKPRILTCYHCVRFQVKESSPHSPQTLAHLWGTSLRDQANSVNRTHQLASEGDPQWSQLNWLR